MKSDRAIMDSARDEYCLIRIPGCPQNNLTTVFCHSNTLASGRGYSYKSFSLCGAYGCQFCHDVVDGRRPKPEGWTRVDVMMAFYQGHERTLVRLHEKGLV